jgi:hypothetical protein
VLRSSAAVSAEDRRNDAPVNGHTAAPLPERLAIERPLPVAEDEA